jgi:hydroxypyruvate isomerase
LDNLQTVLGQLEDKRLDYVRARSMVNSDSQACKDAGIARATYYTWPQDERDQLNELAQQLKRATVARAIMALQAAAEEAAQVKIAGLKSRDERLKQSAATEILDRNIGKPKQAVDVTTGGEPLKIVNIGIDPDKI